tara:strand:+ start:371 stop:574 length:204 start_codon:yes stop_codon:yes gene_type:complete
MIKFYLILITFLILFNSNAFAYIDPGTGGIILQAILGFIAFVGATITLYWRKFKELLKKIFKSKNKE